LIAAQKVAAEIFRNVDDKLHFALCQQIAAFRFSLYLADELVIAAVLQSRKQSPSFRAAISYQDSRRKMFRVSVDGVAEENQLEQRNADRHRERKSVAAHLDKFLDQDRPESR
jgi:hypothetical protein